MVEFEFPVGLLTVDFISVTVVDRDFLCSEVLDEYFAASGFAKVLETRGFLGLTIG